MEDQTMITPEQLSGWLDWYLWQLGKAMQAGDSRQMRYWAQRVKKVRELQESAVLPAKPVFLDGEGRQLVDPCREDIVCLEYR